MVRLCINSNIRIDILLDAFRFGSFLFAYFVTLVSVVASLDNDYDVFGTGIRPVGPDAVSLVPDTFSGEDKSGRRSVDPVASSLEVDQLDEQNVVVESDMDQDDSVNATGAGEFNMPTARLRRVPAVDDLPGFLLAAQLGQGLNADHNESMYNEIMVEMENMNASVNGVGVGIPGAPPGTPEDDHAAGVLDVDVQFDGLDPLPTDNSSEELTFDAGSNLLDSRCMRARKRSLTDDQTDASGIPAGTFQVINLLSSVQYVAFMPLISCCRELSINFPWRGPNVRFCFAQPSVDARTLRLSLRRCPVPTSNTGGCA